MQISFEIGNQIEEIKERLDKIEQSKQLSQDNEDKINQLELKLQNFSGPTENFSQPPPIQESNTISQETIDEINKSIQNKVESLENKFKVTNSTQVKEINEMKEDLRELQSKKYVDPSSVAAHTKDIMELNEKFLTIYGLENKLKDFANKNEFLTNKINKSEKDFHKLLEILDTKSNTEDLNNCTLNLTTALKQIDGLINHTNELQGEINKMNEDTGPDFEKMIQTLQKQVDQNHDVSVMKCQYNEKEIGKLAAKLLECNNLADKNDVASIQTSQQVTSVQKKLDALDEAFNGFMLPKNFLGGAENSEIDLLKESLSSLRKEFFKFKGESSSNFGEIEDLLNFNADKHDLKDLELRLQDKIDKNTKSHMRTKADLRRFIREVDEKVI